MGLKEFFKNKKREKLPLIARVNLTELAKEREKDYIENAEVPLLARADFTVRLPKIRLYYVAFNKINDLKTLDTKIGKTFGVSMPFVLPNGMSIKDACKVVSFLFDKVERENLNIVPGSESCVCMVNKLLSKYGFSAMESAERGHFYTESNYKPGKKIQTDVFPVCNKIEGTIDLFTIGGSVRIFKKTDLAKRYFNWYIKGVTAKDIKNIYESIGQQYILKEQTKLYK